MVKIFMFLSAFLIFVSVLALSCDAKQINKNFVKNVRIYPSLALTDTLPSGEVMEIVKAVVYSTNTFNIESVANLYTPNAVISDDEPPFSWNGPTAGVQWVNAVQHVCKVNRLTKLKGTIEPITIYQHDTDNVYIVVPVSYTANLPEGRFDAKGAFSFVLRLINGRWMIKSQAWLPQKGI